MRWLTLILIALAFQVSAEKNIYETLAGTQSFATLVEAIDETGLIETLKNEGPFTLFAPTDKAFADMREGDLSNLLKPRNREQLRKLLAYHLVPGVYSTAQIEKLKTLNSVEGQPLKIHIKEGKVYINDALMEKADLTATNGMIHIIDTVLIPN